MGKKRKIVYCTPSIYIAGGVERVLTTKANYLSRAGYDVTIVLTDGKDKKPFFALADDVKVINLDIGFEELWGKPFLQKILLYLKKQSVYKRKLRETLMELRPDITISTLRREINFITSIPDGSKKIGEMHINRQNYRNFEANETNAVKQLFGKIWMMQLIKKLKKLDRMVVLTKEDAATWREIDKLTVIPNPLPDRGETRLSRLEQKRVIAVGRYAYQKGFDLLLTAWKKVEEQCPDWDLCIFGAGERAPYADIAKELGLKRCHLNGSSEDILREYSDSSIFVCSSRFEGFGMVILEAMSCGLPAISFNCPMGPESLIDNGKNGLLIRNGDTDALAEAMVELINDPEKRKTMAKGAVEKSQLYDVKNIGKRWEELFEELGVRS